MKKIGIILLCLAMIFVGGCAKSGDTNTTEATTAATEQVYESFDVNVKEFHKRGNVILDITFDELKAKNIEVGDMIKVVVSGAEYEMPVGTSYSDVDSGDKILRFDTEDAKVTLAVNGGSFAELTNMAVKETITEDPGYKWIPNTEKVTITLLEKGGYMDEYTIRNLERTNERSDYATLTDAEYANCREISVTGLKENILYRGTTPLDDSMGRATYAASFIESKGIKNIINLADTKTEIEAKEIYSGSYYAGCNIASIVMDYNFTTPAFAAKVKECAEFIIANDGPFYIHCKEGKDRTGMLCAVLECFAGASLDEVKDDYMQTYINFYKVEKGSETYNIVLRTNFEKVLTAMFGVTTLDGANLKQEATDYLLSSGLTQAQLDSLTAKICK